MKLATILLADHAQIREGTLGILSGFINRMWRDSYPSFLGVQLVIVTEPDSNEIETKSASGALEFWCESPGSSEPLFRGTATIDADLEDARSTYFPFVADLSMLQINAPGEYIIHCTLDDVEVGKYTFYAELIPEKIN